MQSMKTEINHMTLPSQKEEKNGAAQTDFDGAFSKGGR
jgi:hypothetical protein